MDYSHRLRKLRSWPPIEQRVTDRVLARWAPRTAPDLNGDHLTHQRRDET